MRSRDYQLLIAVGLVVLCVAVVAPAEPNMPYLVAELPFFTAYKINEQGMVVGIGLNVFDSGQVAPVGTDASQYSGSAFGLNEGGVAAGWIYNYGTQGFVCQYPTGTVQLLSPLPGTSFSLARGVNNRGLVVGASWDQAHGLVVVWSNGVPTILDSGTSTDEAMDVNDAGMVVGRAQGRATMYWKGARKTLWEGSSTARAVNRIGRAAGWYSSGAQNRPCLFEAEGPADLGTLDGLDAGAALDINDLGQVVGYSRKSSPVVERAFIWEDGELADLNDLVATNSNWFLTEAFSINNRGCIVGEGLHNWIHHGFLLTPAIRLVVTSIRKGLLEFCVDGAKPGASVLFFSGILTDGSGPPLKSLAGLQLDLSRALLLGHAVCDSTGTAALRRRYSRKPGGAHFQAVVYQDGQWIKVNPVQSSP